MIRTKIFSILLMIISIITLVITATYTDKIASYNSTNFFTDVSSFYIARNNIGDFIHQFFGSSFYFLPIVLLVWSYKLYINSPIKLVKSKLILLVYVVISGSVASSNNNVIQAFILYNMPYIELYKWIIVLSNIVLLFFVLSIKITNYKVTLNLLVALVYKGSYSLLDLTKFRSKNKENIEKNQDSEDKKSISIQPNLNYLKSKLSFGGKSKENKVEKYEEDDFIPNENFSIMQPSSTRQKESYSAPIDEGFVSTPKPAIKRPEPNFNSSNEASDSYFVPNSFLQDNPSKDKEFVSKKEILENSNKLEQTMGEFNIKGKVVNIKSGPVVTLYEVSIPAGVKTAKLISLETDIAMRMRAVSVRIAVVPGKDVIGIEIPNKNRKIVYFKDTLKHNVFQKSSHKLPLILGDDTNGDPVVADLATMPHTLIAGTTGSGKSVGINSMILSLLYKFSPEECKLIMIDPKMLELSVYQDIPHLLTPVVTNPKEALSALKWAVREMEMRYFKMSQLGVRNVIGYNEKLKETNFIKAKEDEIRTLKGIETTFDYMPYIVVIIDEMADLMIVAGKEVESAVQRLAQMARAAGIHVIMATQRPSVDVITGTIKANFPTRMSFQVSSRIDSRTILEEQGAEKLLGKGDMLYMAGAGRLQRVHGPFISDEEVVSVVDYLKSIGKPSYIDSITEEIDDNSDESSSGSSSGDDMYQQAIEIIKQEGKVSTSFLQRKLQIGYNRAARIVEQMEEDTIISKPTATGKREILIK